MARVERILSAFPRDADELVGEWPLEGIELGELQTMFNRPAEDPMYDEFEVEPQHLARLERAVGKKLDLTRFEYFVGAVEADNQ